MAAQPLGSRWMRAVNTARSVLSMRGRGLVRRSTATSCRSTRSSTSLADARNASRTSPSTFRKIRYSSRSDTAAIMPNPWATPIIRPIADARRVRRRRRPDRAVVHLHHRPHHAGLRARDRLRRVRIDGRVRRTGRLSSLDPGARSPHQVETHRTNLLPDRRSGLAADGRETREHRPRPSSRHGRRAGAFACPCGAPIPCPTTRCTAAAHRQEQPPTAFA